MARILLVDDDEDILKFAQKLLIKSNHEVVPVNNAVQALEYLEKFSFDMVISDANMPQMSGFELLIKIRSHDSWRNMIVALLTGRKTKTDVERALRLGVDDYIVKPIEPLIFLEKINSMLDKKQLARWPVVEIQSHDKKSEALMLVQFKILEISELGITLKSKTCLKENEIISIQSQFFTDLKLDQPQLRVISVQSSNSSEEWVIKTHYYSAKLSFLKTIKNWIYDSLQKKVI